MPIRLGTSIGKDQPMLNGLKAVSTVTSIDFPSLIIDGCNYKII